MVRKPLANMPEGENWINIPKGEVEWTNSKGQKTFARHAYNTKTGQDLSVRQFQNIQREQRELAGKPKPPTVHRKVIGVTKYKGVDTRTVKSDVRPDKKRLLYQPTEKDVAIWRFYDLESLIEWTKNNSIAPYDHALIEIRYHTYRGTTKQKGGSDKKIGGKGNLKNYAFATISGWILREVLEEQDLYMDWSSIEQKYNDYDLGKLGRVYLYARTV